MVSLRYSSLLSLIALASGCGALVGIDHDYVEVDGALGDASASDAASRDGARSDARTDAGAEGDCPGQIRCAANGACVASCEACAGSIECIKCSNETPQSSCEPAATAYCLGGTYERCECQTSSSCPGAAQVCVSGKCSSCGEPNTNGLKCKSGSNCVAASHECEL
jgi:hypothetical protein